MISLIIASLVMNFNVPYNNSLDQCINENMVINKYTNKNQIKSLVCANKNIEEINILSALTSLEYLDLRDNDIKEYNIVLPNLKELNLSNNEVSIVDVKSLPNLNRLYLSNNLLKSTISNSSLQILDLSGNQIKSIDKSFSKNTNLTTLVLSNNFLNNIDELSKLNKLVDLDVSNNEIISVDKLNEIKNFKYDNNLIDTNTSKQNNLKLYSNNLRIKLFNNINGLDKILPSIIVKDNNYKLGNISNIKITEIRNSSNQLIDVNKYFDKRGNILKDGKLTFKVKVMDTNLISSKASTTNQSIKIDLIKKNKDNVSITEETNENNNTVVYEDEEVVLINEKSKKEDVAIKEDIKNNSWLSNIYLDNNNNKDQGIVSNLIAYLLNNPILLFSLMLTVFMWPIAILIFNTRKHYQNIKNNESVLKQKKKN